jgi:hypothetical protein
MSQVGFEPMIPVFERVKSAHALDRAATVISQKVSAGIYFKTYCLGCTAYFTCR